MQFDLTEDVQFILKKLNENGTGFLVGGAIRDFILNRESEDFDFATDIEYEKLKKIFKNYDPKEVGANFGILTINLNEKSYEIARFRKEKGTQNSRHPMEINFVESIEEDLSRRDFTINSLAYNKEKGLIDIFNGQKDIQNKIIRFIGNPKLRIEEDALRIMRAFRFMAKFGFNLDKRTAQAIYDRKKFLNRISKERIYDELSRILIAPYVKKTLKEMKRLGVLELLIPEFKYLYGTRESNLKNSKTLFINTINIVEKCEKDLVTRYVALFHNLGKINTKNINAKGEVYYYAYEKESAVITEEKLRYFHASNEMISSTKKLILYHTMVYNDISDKDLKKVIIDLNEKNLLRLFNLFEVILKVSKNSGEKLQKLKERIAKLKKMDYY